jgi:Fe2+ or Zn2+ uptake regulation protein
MQIFVKNLSGKTVTIEATPDQTIVDVKKMLEDKEGIAVREQRIVFKGKQCDDTATLESLGVQAMSTLHLVLRLLGGQ